MMVAEQQNAETKKSSSIKLSEELEKKQAEIKVRSGGIENELAEAEPALKSAEAAVESISARDIDSIRRLPNPPKAIKMVMEAVCYMLEGKKVSEWKDIGKIMRSKTFVNDVKNFDVDKISKKIKNDLNDAYFKTPEWNIEKITKAYGCAGALAEFMQAKIRYASIVLSLGPLRKELEELRNEETVLLEQKTEADSLITELTTKIAQLELEYGQLIANVEQIKSEMLKVETKVGRSSNLLENLGSEKIRWEASSQGFTEQLKTMTGDALLSAAFLGYIGFFDQFYRDILMNHWRDYLQEKDLVFRQEMKMVEYLSKPSERMIWQSHHLPSDSLCTENAIILKRFNRYPLIIDPSGQAMEFLLSFYKDKTIARTSFSDEAFMKHLETSLRFGCPILV